MRPFVRVHEVADQIRGVTYVKSEARKGPEEGYLPILRAGNIENDGITYSDLVFVPTNRIGPRQRIRKNDVLIAASSGSLSVVGKSGRAVQEFEGGFGAFCKVLRPSPRVDPSYFAHYFRTSSYRRKISALAEGANINNLRGEHLDNLEIPLPPIEEQRRIAAILDQADALRAKRREAFALLDDLTQSIFVEMFGHTGESPTQQLGNVAHTTSGGTPSRSTRGNYGGHIAWVKSGELHDGLVLGTSEHLSAAGLDNSSAKLMPVGTVLVAMYGATAGVVAVLGIEAATNQAICCIQLGDELESDYFVTWLRSIKHKLLASRAGGAQPNLSQGTLRSLRVPVPPLARQREFSKRIAQIRRGQEASGGSLDTMNELLGSLQFRAFSGRL